MKTKSLITIITLLLVFFIFVYMRIELFNNSEKYLKKENELNYHLNLIELNGELEGKTFWQVFSTKNSSLRNYLMYEQSKYFMFVVMDSISCIKCYNFLVRELSKISKKNNIFILSNNLSLMLKKDLPNSQIINPKSVNLFTSWENKLSPSFLLFVNRDFDILYETQVDIRNVKHNKAFFKKIQHILSE